jgi:hypothetical protein
MSISGVQTLVSHHHHHRLSSWSLPATRINSLPSTILLTPLASYTLRFILIQQFQDFIFRQFSHVSFDTLIIISVLVIITYFAISPSRFSCDLSEGTHFCHLVLSLTSSILTHIETHVWLLLCRILVRFAVGISLVIRVLYFHRIVKSA